MPTYEFKCGDHGVFDVVTTIDGRDDPQPCPTCDGTTDRVFAMPAVKLKGSGYYQTDYANLDKQRAMGRKMVESGEIRPNANLVD